MKIDTSSKILTLKGDEFKVNEGQSLTLGDVIAEAVASDTSGGKMKMYLLAAQAAKGGEMEVDAADMALIKKSVEGCKSYGGTNTIIVGQALVMLEAVK